MGKITIGTVSAGDVVVFDNRPANARFDLNEKLAIISQDGKATITDKDQVAAALKELGIPALKKGMNLDNLNTYVRQLRLTEEAIDAGRSFFRDSLASAVYYAKRPVSR